MPDEYNDIIEVDETAVESTPEGKAVAIVRRDFKRAQNYLKDWHQGCVERFKHYVAPGLEKNILKDKQFPVPFTTEQVDQFVADSMDKIWHKNEPCTMYGRGDADKEDADAKRQFMKYQDDVDDLHGKMEEQIKSCAIYGIAPTVINYRETFDMEDGFKKRPVINQITGNPIMSLDGITPITEEVFTKIKRFTYQGASVEIVDPIDFFFTQEKRDVYDEHPFMIRSRRTKAWFESRNYIIQKNVKELGRAEEAGIDDTTDLLDERRDLQGYNSDKENRSHEYDYVERFGYADLDDGRKLYILGVVDDKVLVRMDEEEKIFDLGKPNIVVGNIAKDSGEIKGFSLVDKFHSAQHAMDSVMGMWLKALRQTVNPMWVVDSSRLVYKKLVNEAGYIIQVKGDTRNVVDRVVQEQISRDVYEGLAMLRQMGQNSSGLSDIASGVTQAGVETLGEASILTNRAEVRSKGGYLRTFEKTWIEPTWKMRNQVNIKFVTDFGYLYSVLEKEIMYWKTLSSDKIRTHVDFVCEASNRESQKSIITQQVLQALNLSINLVPMMGIEPIIKLLEKLYEEGFGWNRSTIREMLPMESIAQNFARQQMLEQQAQQAKQGGVTSEKPQNMPQPTSESEAIHSAQTQFTPQLGAVG